MSILEELFDVVSSYEEEDYESDAMFIYYIVSWENDKIHMNRVSVHYSNEYDGGHGVIPTSKHARDIYEKECPLVDFTNLIISYINGEGEYQYRFGEDVYNSLCFSRIKEEWC